MLTKLDKAISILIKAVIILLPLFFLPWTTEYFEFNKQLLLWLVLPLAALLWLFKTALSAQLKIKINPLNLPILIFLALTAVASIFSLDRFSSFFGYYGRFSDAWLGLASLAIFYFLLINTELADSTKKIVGLLKLFFYSSVVVAVTSLLAMAGGLSNVFFTASFNLAGSSLWALGVYLAIVSTILANFLFYGELKKFERWFFGAGLTVSLAVLALIDFSLSWALLILGGVLIVFFYWLANRPGFKKILNYYLLIPVCLVLLGVFMLALPKINIAKAVLGGNLPKDVLLSYGQGFDVAEEALKKNPALGSGPGTFSEDFSLYRPAELNRSAVWQIRFNKSSSYLLEMLATGGTLTVLSYFLIICLAVYLNIALLKKYLKSGSASLVPEDYNLITALFTAFILIFVSELFFFTNTVLNFIFWLCLAMTIAFWQGRDQAVFKEKIISLNKTVLFKRLTVSLLLVLSAGWVTLTAFEVKFFVADIIAARKYNNPANLITAIKLNPYRYNYQISLAKLYLSQARVEALKPVEQRNNTAIQSNIAKAIETGKRAAELALNSVVPEEVMGMIYRDIRPLTLGSEAWAVKSFVRVLELEPTNPVLATELAKAYLNNNDPVNAEKYFNIALGLKSDYYEAEFGLAKTYLNGKKDNQAFALLSQLESKVASVEVYYELGRYYYNHGQIDKAIDKFKLALSLSPGHSNSLYSLAVAYESQSNFKEALKYYKQVLDINPGNAEVEKKVKELSK